MLTNYSADFGKWMDFLAVSVALSIKYFLASAVRSSC